MRKIALAMAFVTLVAAAIYQQAYHLNSFFASFGAIVLFVAILLPEKTLDEVIDKMRKEM